MEHILLHKKLLLSKVWAQEPHRSVFIYLLLESSQGELHTTLHTIALAVGSFHYSTFEPAKRMAIYRALKDLHRWGSIVHATNGKQTVITICNWKHYQNPSPQPTVEYRKRISGIRTIPRVEFDKMAAMVAEHWKSSLDFQEVCRFTEARRQLIKRRLHHFSVEQLKLAIDHFAADEWHMRQNGHRGMDWFFASDARVEEFVNLQRRTTTAQDIKNALEKIGEVSSENLET